jgi:hypothetical protein
MNIKKSYTEMFPVFKKVLDSSDYAVIAAKTNYSQITVRLVATGISPVTVRNEVILEEAIKSTNSYLQKALKIIGHPVEQSVKPAKSAEN